jgi:SSS family solute:Na+ symporter
MAWLTGYGGSVLVLFLYFAATMAVGLVAWRYFPQSDPESYILGGRGLSWFVAAFTLMATQYSALTFLGFPGTMYRTGLGGFVAIAGMYIGISVLYWLLFAARTWKLGRAFGHMTPADTFAHFYESRWLGYVLAAMLIATLIPYIQAQIVGIAYLLDVATGGLITFQAGTALVYALMIVYVCLGGLRAVAWTDTLQGVLLIGGLVMGAVLVSYAAAGGPVAALATVGQTHRELLTVPGPKNAWPWLYLLSWVIPVGLGWPMHPHMWLKMHIAKSVSYVRLWPLWITFSFPMVMGAALLVGFTGQAARPGLSGREATDTIMISMLLEHFPPLLGGLVAAAGLAAMMSTVSSQIHAVGSSVGRDFLARWFPRQDPRQQVWATRIAVAVVGLMGLYLSLTAPAFITTIGVFAAAWGAQAAPTAIAALAGWGWATRWGAAAGTLGGTAVMLWVGLTLPGQRWLGIYAGLWGLAVNIALFVTVSFLTTPARPSRETVRQYALVGW